MYAHMGKILQDNYPEIVKRTYIINGEFAFWITFHISFSLEETRQKHTNG